MKVNGKKVWSVTWKTLVSVVLLWLAIGGGLLLAAYFNSWEFQHRYGSKSVSEHYLSNSTAFKVQYKRGHYCRTVDAVTGEALTPKLSRIYNGRVGDTLTVFVDKKDRRGYLDTYTGKIVIPAQYEHAWIFSEGLGAVVKQGRLGFLDHKGNWAIPPQYASIDWGVECVFKCGICTVKDTCGLFGIIDQKGNWVLAPEYTKIQRKDHGYRLLVKDYDKGGLADSVGNIVLPCEYDRVEVTEEGVILRKDGRQWMVSPDLKKTIHPYLIDGQSTFTIRSHERDADGEMIEYEFEPIGRYFIGNRLGLLDRNTGRPITPAIYDQIELISPTVFKCKLSDDYGSPSVLVNAKGEEVQ